MHQKISPANQTREEAPAHQLRKASPTRSIPDHSPALPHNEHAADDLVLASAGDPQALQRIIPLIDERIATIAREILRQDQAAAWVNASSLVGRAYVRLLGQRNIDFADEARVLAVLASIMRRIVIDIARRETAIKRGGGMPSVSLHSRELIDGGRQIDALELEDAIVTLANFSPERARIAELHLWGGMTFKQIALAMEMSEEAIQKRWASAKAWLASTLTERQGCDTP
jgi:RNA polymerase sigma-70 factor (ECF subfamily)